jgi:phosphoserine phosphatase RsbU/P
MANAATVHTLVSTVQITPDAVRAMLREDVIPLVLGSGLAAAGLATIAVLALVRRRMHPLLWLGVFSLLYGARLLIRTDTFRIGAGMDGPFWAYAEAAITYIVPVPLILLVRSISPEWRRSTTGAAAALSVFAVCAIAADAVLQRPNAARLPNNLIAVSFLIVLLIWVFRRGQPPTRELRVVRIGVVAFAVTAVADNLRGVGAVQFPGPDLEPFGVIVTVACLGTLVAWRALADARRLVAIDRELGIARDIQSSILPQSMPRIPGVSVAARYRPMTAVAGDFYDFLELGDDRLGVLVADVTGHGVPAALIASMVKVALAAQQERGDRPGDVLAGLNRAMCGRLAGRYVTAAYLFIDVRARVMRYAAAGHPPMLHAPPGAGPVRRVERNGLLLGFFEDVSYDEVELPLDGADRFLLYTDGVIEAANAADDLFGVERLERALASASALAPDAATDAVLAEMDAWSGLPAADDLTLLMVDARV